MNRSLLTLLLSTSLVCGAASGAPLVIDTTQQQSLTLTLYNQNLGLVHDVRNVPQLKPDQRLLVNGISPQMMSETLRVAQAGQIIEQNLNTNLISSNALLRAYVGKPLQLARSNPATGQETLDDIKLLSIQGNQAVIERAGLIEVIPSNADGWRFIFPAIPAGMQSRPSLEIRSNGTPAAGQAVLTYLTRGLSWHMDYAIHLHQTDNRLTLDGLATLANQSGVDYPDSRIRLMAGQVNPPEPPQLKQPRQAMMAMADSTESVAPQQFQDYQLYSLPRRTSLLNAQTKQVSLVAAENVTASKTYQYHFPVYAALNRAEQEARPEIELSFNNRKSDGLGLPLPAGTARVFSPDRDGIMQFIGSAPIRHTAEGQRVKLQIGRAFDITITQRQTEFSKSYDGHLVSHELVIRNSSATSSTVNLNADFSQPWDILDSNHAFQKVSAGRAQWTVTVPGEQSVSVSFQAKLSKD